MDLFEEIRLFKLVQQVLFVIRILMLLPIHKTYRKKRYLVTLEDLIIGPLIFVNPDTNEVIGYMPGE
ncbi:hypothetical protein [Metabacillus fastidiosus]|uniref:hypothetical protein n=1 Tax=Metabacillus fastidiosus TaxID=1458 RepID=UPI003D2B115A